MKTLPVFFLLILFILPPEKTSGEVRLPVLVSNGMILQRDTPVKLWGWASPGETVTLGFLKTEYKAVADSAGSWAILLPPQQAGGPHAMTVSASNTVTVDNILFGDVWLCSGQSNMETPVSRVMTLFGNEIKNYTNPHIRYVKTPSAYNFHGEQTDVPPCAWTDVTPETALSFSALPYFFAKEMYEKTQAPVGIINSSVGGSPIEAWMGEEALAGWPALVNDMRICRSDEFVAEMQRLAPLAGRRWNEVLASEDKGLEEGWEKPGYDDTQWSVTRLTDNSWGRNGSRPRNGACWFRKEIDIPEGMENEDAMLYMGRIIDADYIYVNGTPAGSTGYQYPPRNYPLKPGMLKAGKNLIAVRLISQGGFPGFVEGKPYRIVAGDREVSLEGEWKYRTGAEMPFMAAGGIAFQNKPAGLYNGMIAPLKNFAFKGVIWYQGESNTNSYSEYGSLLTAMISHWRKLLQKQNGELPFFVVQLPNYMEPALVQQHSNWAELRDVQLQVSQTVPNTALAVAIDLGEANDVHPLNKKDLAHRIALQARRVVYGENIVSEGPVYESFRIEGNKVILSFKKGTDDLEDGTLKGFAIAGADGVFLPAEAAVEGNSTVVWNNSITRPKAVRYAWANNPEGANLRNRAGLPASPFQTK